MCSCLGQCSQCGAQGVVGSQCEYCGSTITVLHSPLGEGHSMIQSWDDLHLDGFKIIHDNCKGYTDFPKYQVVEGIRTGKQGLINANGIFVVPCIYDILMADLDSEVCCVSKGGQYGVISCAGDTIIPLCGCKYEDVFVVQHKLIVGFNTIYDLSGNLLIRIPSEERIMLLSSDFVTTYPHHHGLYRVNGGEMILPAEYSVVKCLSSCLFLVSKFTEGVTRYGVYNAESNSFILKTEYLSIQNRSNGQYEARLQRIKENGASEVKTLIFCIKGSDVLIEKEENQTFQTGAGTGCLFVAFWGIVIPISLYFLL